ncbi:hypothetical protein ACQEVF_57605 [Nonomuraea polychroma]|uniref:hypothetical protein n=1 Tax=Nonomuraea polychroma TaxID=46176 RepID=UPI003D8CCEAE
MAHFPLLVFTPAPTHDTIDELVNKAIKPYSHLHTVSAWRCYPEISPAEFLATVPMLAATLPQPLWFYSWEQIVEPFNAMFAPSPDDSGHLHLDADGNAYMITTLNPAARYETARMGGRFSGHLRLRYVLGDAAGDIAALHDHVAEAPTADAAPAALVDTDAIEHHIRLETISVYGLWTRIAEESRPYRSWAAFKQLVNDRDILEAARHHHASRNQLAHNALVDTMLIDTADHPGSVVDRSAAEVVRETLQERWHCLDHIRVDGRWVHPNPDNEDTWASTYLRKVPAGVWVSVVDCDDG